MGYKMSPRRRRLFLASLKIKWNSTPVRIFVFLLTIASTITIWRITVMTKVWHVTVERSPVEMSLMDRSQIELSGNAITLEPITIGGANGAPEDINEEIWSQKLARKIFILNIDGQVRILV